MNPHGTHIEQLFPHVGQGPLQRRARRRDVGAHRHHRHLRQRCYIHLAAGRSGQGVHDVNMRRQHITGQAQTQEIQQFDGLGRDAIGDNISDKSNSLALMRGQHRRFLHGGMFGQHCGYFLGLNAIAADLDLMVQAAKKFEIAILQPAYPVAGAIETLAGDRNRNGPRMTRIRLIFTV